MNHQWFEKNLLSLIHIETQKHRLSVSQAFTAGPGQIKLISETSTAQI